MEYPRHIPEMPKHLAVTVSEFTCLPTLRQVPGVLHYDSGFGDIGEVYFDPAFEAVIPARRACARQIQTALKVSSTQDLNN